MLLKIAIQISENKILETLTKKMNSFHNNINHWLLPWRMPGCRDHLKGCPERGGEAERPDQRDHLPRHDPRRLERVLQRVEDSQVLIHP